MAAKSGIKEIIVGIGLEVFFILSLLDGMSSNNVPYLFFGLFMTITGIFNYTKNYNKNLYQGIMAVIIGSMLIVSYKMYSLGENTVILVFMGAFVLIFILGMYFVPKEWENPKKN